jgi:hypothetical protein
MFRDNFNRWLRAPLVTGRMAVLCGTLALALPTFVRAAVNGVVTGCEFTPYLPFVFLCAVMLRWWQAGAVALASVAILGGVLQGPPRHMLALPCFLPSAGIFLASSAGMIGIAVLVRRVVATLQKPNGSSDGIIFSLDKGEVWASWYGHEQPVRLGSRRSVAKMMDDFLKQEQLAKRLAASSEYGSDA